METAWMAVTAVWSWIMEHLIYINLIFFNHNSIFPKT